MLIVGNRLGAEETNCFRLRSGTLTQLLGVVCPSYERLDVGTQPPQFAADFPFFSAFSVR